MVQANRDKMYPVGNEGSVKTITQGASGTIDLASVVADLIYIHMTASGATAFNVINAPVGSTIILEQDSTGVNNHACTFTGVTINAAGNNVATTNADDESLILHVVSKTRMVIVANNGAVALS